MRMLLLLVLLLAPGLAWAAPDMSGLDWTQREGEPLPIDLPLRDADGRATTLRQVAAGLPLVLAPGYFRCPNLCGVVRDDLFAALSASGLRPGRDYAVALVTIDPAETAADARRAAEGIADRYPGLLPAALTGSAASLDALAAASGFHARFDPASREFLHPAGVVLATGTGTVSSYVLGVGYAPSTLAAAIELARNGGTAVAEPIHLFCFSYNPATGKVSLAAMEAVRLASVLTVLGIAVFLLRMARRP